MSSELESDTLFTVRKTANNTIEVTNSSSNYAGNHQPNDQTAEEENTGPDMNILFIISKNGKTGAAYYNLERKLLFVYDEVIDIGPQYIATRSLYRTITPDLILTLGVGTDAFIKVLIELINSTEDTVNSSQDVRTLPQNLTLLPMKEFTYDIAKMFISNLKLASNKNETSPVKQELYLHSLINFDCRISIQALGGLIKFLEKNFRQIAPDQELIFLYIHQVTLQNHVFIDNASLNTFQIFYKRPHEASFKRGAQSSSREGVSLFKLFSGHCKSKIGEHHLKEILLNPINDIEKLNGRLQFIDFVLQFNNRDFIENLQTNIKHLSDVCKVLTRIQNCKADNNDWNGLYKTIYEIIFIRDLTAPKRNQSHIFNDLYNSVTTDLIDLEQSISCCLDFTTLENRKRPVIRYGLDENLDAKKLRQRDIEKHATAAAKVIVNDLPDFINECAVVYLPETGHFVAIHEWEPNCCPDILQQLGYEFKFNLRGVLHYKTSMCVELDETLGDIKGDIIGHENRIIERISNYVLRYNKDIRRPLRILALIDCLISMARIAQLNNYVRPQLNDHNVHEIEESRHPLMEQMMDRYVINDYNSGGDNSSVKIITGPNGSGKSIYLKQVAVLIYMAHIGSYVPAKRANIAMMHSIHSRIQARESAAVRLSAFMIDIAQATEALHNATSKSLIMLDEFGRGTNSEEGVCLLMAILQNFINQKNCPHILVATHYQEITQYLPESHLVSHLKMNYTMDDGDLCFLYQITHGVSDSYAFDISSAAGLYPSINARAQEIYKSLTTDNCFIEVDDRDNPSLSYGNAEELNIPEPDFDETDE